MRKILKFLINLIYPTKCIFCGKVTEIGKEIFICDECRGEIVFCEDALCCEICDKPQISLGEKNICYTCLTRTYRSYKKAASVVKYEKVTARGIKRYKDGNNQSAGDIFAKLMAKRLKERFPKVKLDLIVGVAPNRKRMMKRGIDPVGTLCENIHKLTGIPYEKGMLKRIKDVPKQSGLSYDKRMKNMIGAFGLNKNYNLDGKTVLLVDDVMTTGATVNECAYILKEGGAKAVYVLTLATTVKEPKTYKNI